MFGAFAGWQTVALKAHRKLCCGLGPGCLLGKWPWPWGACWGGCLEGLEGFGGFGGFWRVFGGCLEGFGRFWRVWRVLEGVWRVWRVLEGLEGFGAFGAFAGWQTAALKANRKPLLWPWPWGACLRSGLGPGVPVGEGVWRVWRVLEGLEGFGGCLEGLEGFGGFGGFGGFWRVFGGFWRVWEGLEGFGAFGAFAGWQTAALKAYRKPLLWPWPWGACWGRCLAFWRGLEHLRASP